MPGVKFSIAEYNIRDICKVFLGIPASEVVQCEVILRVRPILEFARQRVLLFVPHLRRQEHV
jgi:hypothetical protein